MAEELTPIFERHRDAVRAPYYDTESFSARPSDLLMLQSDAAGTHAPLIDALRSSAMFAKPYFVLDQLTWERALDGSRHERRALKQDHAGAM